MLFHRKEMVASKTVENFQGRIGWYRGRVMAYSASQDKCEVFDYNCRRVVNPSGPHVCVALFY